MTIRTYPSVQRSIGIGRVGGLVLALIMSWTFLSFSAPSISFAAERHTTTVQTPVRPARLTVEDPFVALTTKITALATSIAKIATPIATLAIVFALIMQLAGGFLPELMQMHKGFIMRALVIVVVIGFIPQLVTALSSLGAAAGT